MEEVKNSRKKGEFGKKRLSRLAIILGTTIGNITGNMTMKMMKKRVIISLISHPRILPSKDNFQMATLRSISSHPRS
jgi:hypothetical protein